MTSKSIKPNSSGRNITHKKKEVSKILKWDHNIYNASHHIMHYYCKRHAHVSRWRKWFSSGTKNNGTKIKLLRRVSFSTKFSVSTRIIVVESPTKNLHCDEDLVLWGLQEAIKTVQAQDLIHRSEAAREMGSNGGTHHWSCFPKTDAPAEAWWILSSFFYGCKDGEHRPGISIYLVPYQG